MELSILRDLTGFRQRVIDALSRGPVEYAEQFAFIEQQKKEGKNFAGGGVLLPLFFQGEQKSGEKPPASTSSF